MKTIVILQLIFICVFRSNAYTGIGKVNVGLANSTEDPAYSFNINYITGLEVPVYVTVERPADNIPTEAITIECELTPDGGGYSSAMFGPVRIFYPETDEAQVTFSNADSVAGRRTTIQCWANTTSTNDNFPEFSKDVSIGQKGVFEIRPAGTVSTCNAVELVRDRNDYSDNFIYEFHVELSEDVEIGNVSVTCTQNNPSGAIDLEFDDPVLLPIGRRSTPVRYNVLRKGVDITVRCRAETIPISGNQQFIRNTSTGGTAQFTLETGTLLLEPVTTNLRTTEMSAFLVLDSAPEEDLSFYCSVDVADDVSDADDIINAPGCALSTPPTGTEAPAVTEVVTMESTEATTGNGQVPANFTGWLLRNELIEIAEGNNFGLVSLYKIGEDIYAQTERPELVVIRCCAPDNIPEPKYVDMRTGLIAAAYLSPNYTTDWDQATDPDNEENERNILEPQYVEIAECPCDLTLDACDVDCCCDEDCSNSDTDVFECITGAKGGQAEGPPDYRCSAEYFGMKDWFPFMCVQFENSAFLGYFRQPEPATRSDSQYEDIADENRPPYSFEEPDNGEKPPREEGSGADGYTEGIALKSGLQSDGTLHKGANYRLTLPGRAGAGECVWSTPIRYLQDKQETCVWRMSESLCSATSPLNALNYAVPSQGGSTLCRKGLLLLAQQGLTEIAYTNVDYLCAGDNTTLLSPYLRSNATARDVYPEDQVKLFDYELPNGGEDCTFDEPTGAYVCEALVIGGQLPTMPLPPRCAWDDGNTDAPTPSIDYGGFVPVCHNAVVDVYYNFTWKGTEIVMLNATVILGDIPLEQESEDFLTTDELDSVNSTFLTQLLKVEFEHDIDYTNVWDYVEEEINADPDQDNITLPWTRNKYQRSGKEGYLDDLPIISGVAVGTEVPANDTSGSQFDYVDTNLTSQLTLWSPGADGLCENAGRTNINFSQNAIGSCLLRLGYEELQDCNYLRKLVLNRQDNLMIANYVAMIGDPNPRDLSDWIQVLRENVSDIITDESPENSTYLGNVTGLCTNVPATIHVDIMWAKAGEHNATDINDIVGARINYKLHTWALSCSAKSGAACYGDTRWREDLADGRKFVQSFTLQSSVRFIEVPPEEPETMSQYEEDRAREYEYCTQDACWEELFYPWTQAYRGIDKEVVLGSSLAFLIFIIGLYMISRPWY